LFIASFALAILVKKVYRPWVYTHGAGFIPVADWGPSLFYIFGFMMLTALLIAATGRMRHLKFPTMVGVAIGAMMYEISHAFRADRWFSWDDLIATIVGGLSAIIVEVILTRTENATNRESMSFRS
jgi:hypothetical protein